MAPRSLKLYVKLAAAACVQIAIQFTYSIAFSLTGPLFSQQFRMKSAGVNVIFSLIGPLIGFFVQPIMGAVGDRCTFKFGRRRIFLLIGMIIDIIGTICICLSSYIDEAFYGMDASESGSDSIENHIVGVVLGITGIFIAFFGVNIMQAPSRAIVSDIFDAENQQDANLMINAFCGLASICCFLISAFMTESDAFNLYTVMFGLCACVVVIATIPTLLFAKEKRYVPEEGSKTSIAQPFIDLFQAIKMIRLDIVFILLSLMLGWFAYQPLSTNFTVFVQKEIFPEIHEDEGLQMAMFMMTVFAAVQFVSVIIFPFITSVIGEITTFLVFQGLAAVSYAMIIVINFTFPEEIDSDESKPAYYSSIALGFISVVFPAMAFVQTNSLPYSMLKKVVPEERYGAFVGLLNCAVVIAQFLCSGLISLIQIGIDSYLVGFVIAFIAALLCCGGSVVLYFVKTTDGSAGEKQKLVENAEAN